MIRCILQFYLSAFLDFCVILINNCYPISRQCNTDEKGYFSADETVGFGMKNSQTNDTTIRGTETSIIQKTRLTTAAANGVTSNNLKLKCILNILLVFMFVL